MTEQRKNGRKSRWGFPVNSHCSKVPDFLKKQECTYFISIPFKNEHLKRSFNVFREDLIQNYQEYRVNADIIQKTEKLHKTILNLNLGDDTSTDHAKDVLEGEKEALRKILNDAEGKHVTMRGVKKPGNLRRVNRLSANVLSEVIPKITVHLTTAFAKAGLKMSSQTPNLHQIVVMNENLLIPENWQNIDYTFNPKPVLKKYGDYEFGSFDVEEIHLSRR
ncbi:uncharacterized protein LOC132259121 [Phlebotomus argentipes]|uniref:uncharacterized protein LOC132259121 n=1 Tax=Phlebotomus argentipes TaxID=94469 RepID=UPI0028930E03|nr:uncharacterized protein LOC132259121 [Phlebotomus argentipes]